MTITRTTPLAELPELLKVVEAAAWAGTSSGLIREAVRKGQLREIRLGRLVFIARADLARLVGRNPDALDAPIAGADAARPEWLT